MAPKMRFFSDNAAAACPEALAALAEANRLDTAYDGDEWSKRLNSAFSALFEREVEALWVSTGTAANSLALAALCPPHRSIVCHRDAHIQTDECGAPEFYTGGAKLLLGEGEGAKLTPEGLEAVLATIRRDVHQVQPAALSITNASEYGCVYSPAETSALGDLARKRGLRFHLDGARFANAVASQSCAPADLSWRAGVDALSFGFTKNGALAAEALILFDPALSEATHYRRKRAGHLLSKGRYLAAQILAMVEDGLWLRNARAANEAAARLAAAAGGDRLLLPVQANEMFIRVSPEEAAALRAQGFDFYDWGPGEARLVTSWDSDPADVYALAAAISAL
jgi:threonine aldolase